MENVRVHLWRAICSILDFIKKESLNPLKMRISLFFGKIGELEESSV